MAPIQLPIASKFLWLCALALQLYLGFTIVEEILIRTDSFFIPSVCGLLMTMQFKRYTIIASALALLSYLMVMITVSWALEKSFYWTWGNMWKRCWVGRAANWMWGPVERENRQVEDLEKILGFEDRVEVVNGFWKWIRRQGRGLFLSDTQAMVPFKATRLFNITQNPAVLTLPVPTFLLPCHACSHPHMLLQPQYNQEGYFLLIFEKEAERNNQAGCIHDLPPVLVLEPNLTR
jgi:hypothetical protein